MTVSLKDVFGIRVKVNEYSYIDRGGLDEEIAQAAKRDQHIALKGESKSGKSWLRQKLFPDANVIPCRLDHSTVDLYRQILANLDISLEVEKSESGGAMLSFEAASDIGWSWLAKAKGSIEAEGNIARETVRRSVGHDEFDFAFLAAVIKASKKRIVIEDFHYLSAKVQRDLAHDLKTFWDYEVFFVVVGVWHRKNYITYLNSDVAGRVYEVSVYWSNEELAASVAKGAASLNIGLVEPVPRMLANDSYNNIGILQSLVYMYCEIKGIVARAPVYQVLSDTKAVEDAGMLYADQIEAVYQLFADKVSEGIRRRKDSTQIYAYAMQTIVDAADEELVGGLSIDTIFERAHAKQSRIQKGNLRTVLSKFREIQIDDRGKGLVLAFDEPTQSVIVVDRGLLFYRKYATAKWPWERLAQEAEADGTGLKGESAD